MKTAIAIVAVLAAVTAWGQESIPLPNGFADIEPAVNQLRGKQIPQAWFDLYSPDIPFAIKFVPDTHGSAYVLIWKWNATDPQLTNLQQTMGKWAVSSEEVAWLHKPNQWSTPADLALKIPDGQEPDFLIKLIRDSLGLDLKTFACVVGWN